MSLRPIANTNGRVTAMTLITPLRPGWLWWQRLVFGFTRAVPSSTNRLRGLAYVHFGWWAILSRLPYNGPPQRPERLNNRYLVFESNFDGAWPPYIDAFGQVLRWRVNALWMGSCGYPGARPTTPAIDYVDVNQFPVDHFYAAYPEATNPMVLAALRLREQFDAFQAETAHLDDDRFQAAYERFVRGIQRRI
jgi:hypothetical protein